MTTHDAIQSQYRASLEMLHRAIVQCSDALWTDPEYKNPFWHVAYHALFYTHLYLQDSGTTFVPWAHHRQEYEFLGPLSWPPHKEPDIGAPYTKQEVLEYLAVCRDQVELCVPALDLDAASGFDWLPFNKLELQFYNIRHLQHHTGQLVDRVRTKLDAGVGWVSKGGGGV